MGKVPPLAYTPCVASPGRREGRIIAEPPSTEYPWTRHLRRRRKPPRRSPRGSRGPQPASAEYLRGTRGVATRLRTECPRGTRSPRTCLAAAEADLTLNLRVGLGPSGCSLMSAS